jgi:2'-5' RNA ligase
VTARDYATQSALLIAVPEADDVVSPWRERLDTAARLGVPAHITLLYPFAHPTAIYDGMRAQLREALRKVARFDFTLHTIRWFDYIQRQMVAHKQILPPDPASNPHL